MLFSFIQDPRVVPPPVFSEAVLPILFLYPRTPIGPHGVFSFPRFFAGFCDFLLEDSSPLFLWPFPQEPNPFKISLFLGNLESLPPSRTPLFRKISGVVTWQLTAKFPFSVLPVLIVPSVTLSSLLPLNPFFPRAQLPLSRETPPTPFPTFDFF